MNSKFSKFQIITLLVFGLFIVVGVATFAFYKGNSSSSTLTAITVWGTFPKNTFDQYVVKISNNSSPQINVTYTQKTPDIFISSLISALARGQGPDAILIPTELLLPLEDKLALIPYTAMPQRTFLDTYVQESNIYINQNGVMGFPFTLDPLVMYWNRDMFNAAGIATYPKYWDDFTTLNKSLTTKDVNGNLRKSAIALGQFSNINNAREIFGSILIQAGNPVTGIDNNGHLSSTLTSANLSVLDPVIKFFAQFIDPSSVNYSWNKSMPDSKSAFLSGNLATYFGFASELSDIRTKNPNLNFDVALLPGPKGVGAGATYGRMYGFSLLRSSPNLDSAFKIISMLSAPEYLGPLSDGLYLPSVRRDVLANGSTDSYISLFDRAALVSTTWLDADPAVSGQIFSDMVQSFASGKKSISQTVQDAGDLYNNALNQALTQ